MRLLLIVISVSVIFWCSVVLAQSPPLSIVTIEGETETKFNKVSLFKSGGSKEPFKTEYISEYEGNILLMWTSQMICERKIVIYLQI